jgi:hypothetical protein
MSITTDIVGWSSVFPESVSLERESCKFMKKMMAIAISNIAYFRLNFPLLHQ